MAESTQLPMKVVKSILLALSYGAALDRNPRHAVYSTIESAIPDPGEVIEFVDRVCTDDFLCAYARELRRAAAVLLPDARGRARRRVLALRLQALERRCIDAVAEVVGEHNVIAYIHDGLIARGGREALNELESTMRTVSIAAVGDSDVVVLEGQLLGEDE